MGSALHLPDEFVEDPTDDPKRQGTATWDDDEYFLGDNIDEEYGPVAQRTFHLVPVAVNNEDARRDLVALMDKVHIGDMAVFTEADTLAYMLEEEAAVDSDDEEGKEGKDGTGPGRRKRRSRFTAKWGEMPSEYTEKKKGRFGRWRRRRGGSGSDDVGGNLRSNNRTTGYLRLKDENAEVVGTVPLTERGLLAETDKKDPFSSLQILRADGSSWATVRATPSAWTSAEMAAYLHRKPKKKANVVVAAAGPPAAAVEGKGGDGAGSGAAGGDSGVASDTAESDRRRSSPDQPSRRPAFVLVDRGRQRCKPPMDAAAAAAAAAAAGRGGGKSGGHRRRQEWRWRWEVYHNVASIQKGSWLARLDSPLELYPAGLRAVQREFREIVNEQTIAATAAKMLRREQPYAWEVPPPPPPGRRRDEGSDDGSDAAGNYDDYGGGGGGDDDDDDDDDDQQSYGGGGARGAAGRAAKRLDDTVARQQQQQQQQQQQHSSSPSSLLSRSGRRPNEQRARGFTTFGQLATAGESEEPESGPAHPPMTSHNGECLLTVIAGVDVASMLMLLAVARLRGGGRADKKWREHARREAAYVLDARARSRADAAREAARREAENRIVAAERAGWEKVRAERRQAKRDRSSKAGAAREKKGGNGGEVGSSGGGGAHHGVPSPLPPLPRDVQDDGADDE